MKRNPNLSGWVSLVNENGGGPSSELSEVGEHLTCLPDGSMNPSAFSFLFLISQLVGK